MLWCWNLRATSESKKVTEELVAPMTSRSTRTPRSPMARSEASSQGCESAASMALKSKVESALRIREMAAEEAATEAIAKVEAKQVQLEALFTRLERLGTAKSQSPPPLRRDGMKQAGVAPKACSPESQSREANLSPEEKAMKEKLADAEARLRQAEKDLKMLQRELDNSTLQLRRVEAEKLTLQTCLSEAAEKADGPGVDVMLLAKERAELRFRLGDLEEQLQHERDNFDQQLNRFREERAEAEERLKTENRQLRKEIAGNALEREHLLHKLEAAERLAGEVGEIRRMQEQYRETKRQLARAEAQLKQAPAQAGAPPPSASWNAPSLSSLAANSLDMKQPTKSAPSPSLRQRGDDRNSMTWDEPPELRQVAPKVTASPMMQPVSPRVSLDARDGRSGRLVVPVLKFREGTEDGGTSSSPILHSTADGTARRSPRDLNAGSPSLRALVKCNQRRANRSRSPDM